MKRVSADVFPQQQLSAFIFALSQKFILQERRADWEPIDFPNSKTSPIIVASYRLRVHRNYHSASVSLAIGSRA
ncbi:hypothetical protein QT971_17155, partial [Microcoleus sp. herbarium19]